MFRLLRNRNGFSVLEAIISIAAIGLMSGFILRMFLVSDMANRKAETVDRATFILMSEVELYKAQKNPDAFADVDVNQSALVVLNEKGCEIWKLYDKNWEQLNARDYNLTESSIQDNAMLPSGVQFKLKLSFERDEGKSHKTDELFSTKSPDDYNGYRGEYIDIEATVHDVHNEPEKQKIVEINTGKYFSY